MQNTIVFVKMGVWFTRLETHKIFIKNKSKLKISIIIIIMFIMPLKRPVHNYVCAGILLIGSSEKQNFLYSMRPLWFIGKMVDTILI